jgi:uncharacterized protein
VGATEFTIVLLAVGAVAGGLGALLGLGGGFIIVPALTLLFGINIRVAIAASLVSVIATSSGAAVAFVREHLANLRVGNFLELSTVTGAITGALLASVLVPRVLYIVFAVALAQSAVSVARRKRLEDRPPPPADRLSDRLRLHSSYPDAARSRVVDYRVARARVGLVLMYLAGVLSGLLGIGSGTLKVPAMDLAMGLPMKVSSATSNFMIGVTAAASTGVYFARGDMSSLLAAPIAVGGLAGALVASRLLGRLPARGLRVVFAVVVFALALQMLVKGLT